MPGLRAIKLIMYDDKVQNDSSTLGVRSIDKNCNRVILEKSLKERRLDMNLKKYGDYFGLALMGYPY